jgi:hypothetical protein
VTQYFIKAKMSGCHSEPERSGDEGISTSMQETGGMLKKGIASSLAKGARSSQ